MRHVRSDDAELAQVWNWLVPSSYTPLMLSVFGDWVYGAPDGSLWRLSILEGDFCQVAANRDEFNLLKRSAEWLDEQFMASWQEIAERYGFVASDTHCIAWRVPPIVGGPFERENLQLLPHRVYQAAMSSVHQQLLGREVQLCVQADR